MVSQALHAYDELASLNYIDPSSIKNAVGAPGGAKKPDVLIAVRQMLARGEFGVCTDVDSIDDNAVDAIAIAYVTYLRTLVCHFRGHSFSSRTTA